jgi:hypothetical protein
MFNEIIRSLVEKTAINGYKLFRRGWFSGQTEVNRLILTYNLDDKQITAEVTMASGNSIPIELQPWMLDIEYDYGYKLVANGQQASDGGYENTSRIRQFRTTPDEIDQRLARLVEMTLEKSNKKQILQINKDDTTEITESD